MSKRLFFLILFLLTYLAVGRHAGAQEFFDAVDDPEWRYQFMAHNFTTGGVNQEIFIKLDRFTGKTWRFHASNPRWEPIPESSGGRPLGSSDTSRYELIPHDYLDQKGESRELYLRVDMVSGFSWTYQGAGGTWQDVPQGED